MNIKKLKVGMEIKNYKELCSLLGESVKTGGAKNKQMKEFKKYFEFKKDGHSFLITKIYNKPRAIDEQEIIELLLLNLFFTNDNDDMYTILATRKNMYEKLKMVNSNYKYCFNNPHEIATYKNIPNQVVIETKDSIDRMLKIKLENALEKLSDRKIIMYHDVYMVCYLNDIYNHRIATDDEIKICGGIEGDILKELNCDSYTDVFIQKKERIYNKRLSDELSNYNIKCFYKCIKIIFMERKVGELIDKYVRKYKLSKKNYSKYIGSVNNSIQLQAKNNAQSRIKNANANINEISREIEKIKQNINMLDEKIGKKHTGFSLKSFVNDDRHEYLNEQNEEFFKLEKYERKLETMGIRLNSDYSKHVDELIKLIIDMDTENCIADIRQFCND